MRQQFGVTIQSRLETHDIQGFARFPHAQIIDLRYRDCGSARPFEEAVFKRLRSYFIDYEQVPTNLEQPTARQENRLFRMITEQSGNLLIVTEQVAAMARFCRDVDIPYFSRELAVVETTLGDMPIQLAKHANRTAQPVVVHFDSLAG